MVAGCLAGCAVGLAGPAAACGGDAPSDRSGPSGTAGTPTPGASDAPADSGPPSTHPSATLAHPPTAPPPRAWDGDVEVDLDTGEVTAAGFNDVIDEEQPEWAGSAAATARALLHLPADEDAEVAQEDTDGGAVVTVTRTDLADASTEAIRHEFTLVAGDDGLFRFDSGTVQWRCRPDRGPQEFSTEACL